MCYLTKVLFFKMRLFLAFSLLVTPGHAFVPPESIPRSTVSVASTLAPEAPSLRTDRDDSPEFGGISMQIDELAEVLGGKGRAQIVWDCYSIGIDPSNFFGSVIELGYDDYESIVDIMPSQRRGQKLGPGALEKLSSLYCNRGGQVEGGVAKLSYISRAGDKTTKLLLKLSDGLEVETVIIPWKEQRSTLCISSQVGCRQGRNTIQFPFGQNFVCQTHLS